MSNVYINQPLRLEITCIAVGYDMADAVSAAIAYRKPDGTESSWAAAVSPLTGIVSYDIAENILDQAGNWKLQPSVTFPGSNTIPGTLVTLPVNKRFT